MPRREGWRHALVFSRIRTNPTIRGFLPGMQASHRIQLRAAVLFLGCAFFILWLRYSPDRSSHRPLRTSTDANSIFSLCEMYRINNGFYPSTEQGLLAFVREPRTIPIPDKWTAFAQHVPIDPWGTEYRYQCDNPYSEDRKSIRILSAGKDGTFATEDDLIYPNDPPPMSWGERLRGWLR